jgi:hypothetical protein
MAWLIPWLAPAGLIADILGFLLLAWDSQRRACGDRLALGETLPDQGLG